MSRGSRGLSSSCESADTRFRFGWDETGLRRLLANQKECNQECSADLAFMTPEKRMQVNCLYQLGPS